MPKKQQETNLVKPLILIGLISSMFIFSAVVISSYPQHLYLDNQSVIDATIGYFNNNTVNIRGNQVQYSTGDVIVLEGRDYIRITGNQKQIGDDIFTGAIRTVTASISQNILFEQKVGIFSINSAGKVLIDDVVISLIPVSSNILNIRTVDSNYNVEFVSGVVYITSKDTMLKLVQNNDDIEIYLIGTKNYNKVLFVKI